MRLLFFVVIVASAGALPVHAQRTPPPPPEPANEDDGATGRFRLADSYLQAGQHDRAIALLEDLLAAHPGTMVFIDRLKDAYVASGRVEDAIELLQRHIAERGPATQLLAELGSLHMSAGNREAAEAAWRRAVDAAPDNVQTYRALYSALVRNRMWEKARDLLLEGRRRLGQPDLFRIELAELYSRSNQHAESLEEWAALLTNGHDRMAFVQSRIGRMLDQEGVGTAFRDALDRLIRREPMRLPYRRLAAWLAAEMGDFAGGLDHIRAVDRLGGESGESLLAYAESALEAGAYAEADRAFEIVLELHPRGSPAAAALLSSGLLHERLAERNSERVVNGNADGAPHYTEAIRRYERFLQEYPASPARDAARRQLARLHRDVFRDYARARTLLEEVISSEPHGDDAVYARFALGVVALLEDDLQAARIAFTRIDNQVRLGDRAERARFELALLDYYEGHFEMALSRVNAMKRNTATDVANNAIDLKLILTENRGPDSLDTPLRAFADAELRIRQRRYDEALERLESVIASARGHAVVPLARFRVAETLRAVDRVTEALAELQSLPQDFPESYLADRALFMIAEIHERELRDPAAAMDAYTALLSRYPGSLLAPEARTRIRRLRGDLPS